MQCVVLCLTIFVDVNQQPAWSLVNWDVCGTGLKFAKNEVIHHQMQIFLGNNIRQVMWSVLISLLSKMQNTEKNWAQIWHFSYLNSSAFFMALLVCKSCDLCFFHYWVKFKIPLEIWMHVLRSATVYLIWLRYKFLCLCKTHSSDPGCSHQFSAPILIIVIVPTVSKWFTRG